MRAVWMSVIGVAWLASTPSVRAEVLRCGSVLIGQGDSAGYVLEKCGEPDSRTTLSTPVWTRDLNGNEYQAGTTQSEIWRYIRGVGKFPALVKISGGVVREIKFEKQRH